MLVERELAVIDHLAAVMVVEHALAAGGDPFHRPAQLARRPQHQHVVRERPALEAEAAADVGRHHADVVLRHVQHVRQLHAHAVRILRRGVERVEIVDRVVVADRDARLHRDRREPVVLDAQLDHVLGLGEGRVGRVLVAEHQAERDIAVRVVVPDLGRAVLGGVLEIDHRRQRLVLDLDQLGGVARLRQRLGDHERDPVADVTDPIGDQDRLPGAVALGRAEILRHRMRGERAEIARRPHRRRSARRARRARPWPWRCRCA